MVAYGTASALLFIEKSRLRSSIARIDDKFCFPPISVTDVTAPCGAAGAI